MTDPTTVFLLEGTMMKRLMCALLALLLTLTTGLAFAQVPVERLVTAP